MKNKNRLVIIYPLIFAISVLLISALLIQNEKVNAQLGIDEQIIFDDYSLNNYPDSSLPQSSDTLLLNPILN